MKRQISTLLLIAMLAGTAVSCGESGTPSETTTGETTTAPEVTTELTDGLPDKNMEGFTLNLLNATPDSMHWAIVTLDVETENGEPINDAIYKRNREIEERFECDISVTTNNYYDTATHYNTVVMAGDNLYDIVMVVGTEILRTTDYVANFENLPYVNLEADWWNPGVTDILNIGGKQIAAAGNFSLSYASITNCLLFNKRIYADMNRPENLYDLVREGKWTFDKYIEIAKDAVQDVDGNTVMDDNDIFGYAGLTKNIHNQLIIGSGMHFVNKDEEGFPVFDAADDEKFVGFLQKIVNLYNGDPYVFYWPVKITEGENNLFTNGTTLFVNGALNAVEKYRDMKDDFGFLPAPKYDEQQEKYYSNMSNGEVATLPRSYDPARAENIGILLEAMSFYTQKEIFPVYKDVVLQTKYVRDEDSAEMLDIILSGITCDFGVNVWQTSVNNIVMENIIYAKSDQVVSYLTYIKNSLVPQIEALRTSIEQMP